MAYRRSKHLSVLLGANSGIGKVTAHELSKRGAKIVMLCRDLENAEEAADDIRKDTGNVVAVLHLDLSSLESVRKWVKNSKL